MSSSTTDRRLGLTGGTAFKAPCACATTGNITLSGEQTIDGVTTSASRVLAWQQTTAAENGIYDSDSGAWTRALDFDGANDVVQGTQVYVNGGTSYSGATFVVTTSGTITPGSTSLTLTRTGAGTVTKTSSVASTGQTAFTVATYQTGANSIDVYVNGLRQRLIDDYAETNSTTITFTYGLLANDEVDTYSKLPVSSMNAVAATSVSVTDSTDHFVGTTVEAALAELANGIAVDVGDADITLTNASSATINRWNTALTANRTATFSTSNAKEGATFLIVRGAGATGNYTLAAGTLATLRAPGQWCMVGYDAGTTAWILLAHGYLLSSGIQNVAADVGDASATLTVGTSSETQRWATVLTADRTATLSTTGAWAGAKFKLERTEAATGSFSLIVSGTAQLLRLAPGQYCVSEYTGTAWIITGFGDIRPGVNTTIELFDDFLGEEINGHVWQSLIGTDSACLQAVVRPEQVRGITRLVTGADVGGTMALNGVQLHSRLNWRANQGGLVCEFRLMMDAITSVCVFIGLTDQDSGLEMPFTLGVADALTSNATDAVGVLFDTDAATDNWWLVGVAGNVDATKQNSAVAPVASTMETWRIEISATGTATFYRNAVIVGSAMSGAVTETVALTPIIAAFSRTNASRNVDADCILVQAQR